MKNKGEIETITCDVCGKKLKGLNHSYFVFIPGLAIYSGFRINVFFRKVADSKRGVEKPADICEECSDNIVKDLRRKV